MTIFDFQNDLKNGMSISEALQKHNLTFKKAFNMLSHTSVGRPPKPRSEKRRVAKTGEKYIGSHESGSYFIRRLIDGEWTAFGSYSTLEDAIKIRDMCIKHGWVQSNVDEYCRQAKVIRRWDTKKPEKVRYH